MSAVSWVGVPSSSNGSVPRRREAAPLSPTLRTGFPKRRPRVIMARACGFSYTKSASERCPNASWIDRKSTRLNSSHGYISYAVFCLKKKKKKKIKLERYKNEDIVHTEIYKITMSTFRQ